MKQARQRRRTAGIFALPRIAVILPTSFGYGRSLMAGAMAWLAKNPANEVLWFQSGAPPADMLRKWGVKGILGHFPTLGPGSSYLRLGVPLVNLSASVQPSPVVTVCCDHRGLGERAAEYLHERGLRNFGYLGFAERRFSAEREAGFRAGLGGSPVATLALPSEMWSWLERMRDWVAALPKPCGAFCVGDNEARVLLTVCLAHGVRVPEDLAILGCNNERDVCASCHPPLSSVRARAREIAETGMEQLRGMLRGEVVPETLRLRRMPPGPVEERGSTDIVLAVKAPEINAALRHIRDHIHEPLGVDDLLKVYAGSRRSLEQRFRSALGRSPLEEIHRVRLKRIDRLLRDTDDTLSEIAADCGLSGPGALGNFYRKHRGISPQAARRESSFAPPDKLEQQS